MIDAGSGTRQEHADSKGDVEMLSSTGDENSCDVERGPRVDPWVGISHDAIARFLDVLLIERGLGRKALTAYRVDLHKLDCWMKRVHGRSAIAARTEELQQYFAEQGAACCSLSARKRARTSARRFYEFLRESHFREDDPMVGSSASPAHCLSVLARDGIEAVA